MICPLENNYLLIRLTWRYVYSVSEVYEQILVWTLVNETSQIGDKEISTKYLCLYINKTGPNHMYMSSIISETLSKLSVEIMKIGM